MGTKGEKIVLKNRIFNIFNPNRARVPLHMWFHPWNLGYNKKYIIKNIKNIYLKIFKYATSFEEDNLLDLDNTNIWEKNDIDKLQVIDEEEKGFDSGLSNSLSLSMSEDKRVNLFIQLLERRMERFQVLEKLLQSIYEKLLYL